MAEYIERDAVLEAIESTDWYHLSEQGNMVHGAVSGENAWYKADDIYKVLEEIPAADVVEVVHGRWIDNVDKDGFLCNAWRKCSACGGLNFSKKPPYCPNCGAKMDLE